MLISRHWKFTSGLPDPQLSPRASRGWLKLEGLGEEPDIGLIFCSFHLCCLNLQSVVLLSSQLGLLRILTTQSPQATNPQNTLVCVTPRKCSVPLSLSFRLCEMGIMLGVGNTFPPPPPPPELAGLAEVSTRTHAA